jgi:hypothetical protein
MENRDDDDRPPYKLTERQGDLWDAFEKAAEKTVEGLAREEGLTDKKMERLCLDMLVGMLDQQFKESHYDSIVLSALAIMGIAEDGGWVEPTKPSPCVARDRKAGVGNASSNTAINGKVAKCRQAMKRMY